MSDNQPPARICVAANAAWNLYHFRLNHLRALREAGMEVHAVAPPDGYERGIEEAGFTFHPWRVNRASLNPFGELGTLLRLGAIYRRVRPHLVHHYTVKPLLYGTTMARLFRVPGVVNSVTGLPLILLGQGGHPLKRTARWASMRWYAWSVGTGNTRMIAQNRDDLRLLSELIAGVESRSVLTNGSGVDLTRFEHRPLPGNRRPVVLFVGRCLREKGIYELMDAARQLRSRAELPFELRICGRIDPGNRSSATQTEVDRWVEAGLIDRIDYVDDVRSELEAADVVVLPSYREGTPRSMLEAMAVGRPLVTTDVPGCREVVEDGRNGRLVPVRDADALAGALAELLADAALRTEMAQQSRQMAEERFDERIVIEQTLEAYWSLLNDE